MHKLIFFLKSIICEALVIFLLILTFNNYLGNDKETINADGIGYYEYLPSTIVYHDINRKAKPVKTNPEFYNRIINTKVYIDYKEYKLNKYPCGAAVLISPFFIYKYISFARVDNDVDAYSEPFQPTVFYAAIFYLFLGLFFFKKLLQLYDVNLLNIFFLQLLIALATSVTNYVYNEAAFSHVYSLFAVSGFLFFSKSYFSTKNINKFIWACVFLALIALIRNINIIIVFFIPFLAGSVANLKEGFLSLFKQPIKLGIAILCMVAIVSIQCIFWYLETGEFIVYSYKDEGFNFLSPAFTDILFSYKKGLFVYTPIVFISLFGLVRLGYNRQYYLLITWLAGFLFINYILSSWWCWYYGGSYGLRAYIEFYPVFFLLFGLFINHLNLWVKIPVVLISLLTIPVNIIQTYQYKEYILNWSEMNKKGYWEVFLKQDDRYKGYLWKRNYDINKYYVAEKEVMVEKIVIPENTETSIMQINSNTVNQFNKVSLIQVKFENSFNDEIDGKLVLSVSDSTNNTYSYYGKPPLIYFAEEGFNKYQTGVYNFEVPLNANPNQVVKLGVYSNRKDSLTHLKVTFFSLK
ncbi:MAG: hypothetical protein ABI388_09565 [Bacteroidia bacterium]